MCDGALAPGVYTRATLGVDGVCRARAGFIVKRDAPPGSYLSAAGQVLDELEARDSPLRARHADVFRVLAVRDAKAVGLTLCQALLAAVAVQVVEPNMAWNGERRTDVYCEAQTGSD